uniref:SLC12 domain-containing protein n=1 Tax=Elaeophora elaphi TaxID=1147741 RepID=A0A0R3RS21_9BILA
MLKSPTKTIPTGIFSSLLTMLFLLIILTCSLALGIERHLLLDKYGRGTYPNFPIIFTLSSPVALIAGLMLMSTVAAMQSMYTAKSLLLSIITSHTIPVPRFFYQRSSRRRKLVAVAITALLILPYLFVNSLDYMSIIASSCMLVALIAINIGTIICSTLNFPSFHPTFRSFRSFLAVFGIIACAIMLYGCKPLVGVVVSSTAVLIYVIFPLHRRHFRRDTPYAIVVDIANMLLYSSTQKTSAGLVEQFHSKPRCIVFTRFPAPCDNLLRMAKILSQNRSALCLSLIRDTGDQENIGSEDVRTARQYMDYIDLSGYATQFKYQKISSLHSIASALASCCGLGVFQSNTVMIEYPSEAALSGLPDSLLYHYHMHRVCVQHCNLVVVKGIFPLKIPLVQSNKTIDIWWIIDNGDVLLMVAKMLKNHEIWRKVKLRLFVVVDIEDNIKKIVKALLLWLIDNHYLIYEIEFIRADFRVPNGMPAQNAVDSGFHGVITSSVRSNTAMKISEQQQRARQLNKEILRRSSDAVLVLMNMPEPPVHLERFWKYLNFLNDMSNELKKVLFVRGVDVQSNVDLETSTTKE